MLQVLDIQKAYEGRTVLDGVDLTIAGGEIVALLGANGAGKTTLLSIVSGLRRADHGEVRLGGRNARDPSARRLLGVAPQALGVYATLPVRRNLELFGRLAGQRRRELRESLEWISSALGLADLLDRPAGELSGGQQRRLHTAMAMIGRPSLLLLDEPTVGADVGSRAQILGVVRDVARAGCAICYTTHHLQEIHDLGADLAVLHGGRIVARGTAEEVGATLPPGGEDDGAERVAAIYDHYVGAPPPPDQLAERRDTASAEGAATAPGVRDVS